MLEKTSTFFNDLFGDAGKWVLLAVLCVLLALCITLVIFITVNIKWVLLGGSSAAIFVILGFIVKKKIEKDV